MNRILQNLSIATFLLSSVTINAQNIGINSTGIAPSTDAMLDISSTTKGLLIPRVNITNLSAIAPVTGGSTTSLLVYNTNVATGLGYYYWDGAKWVNMSGDDWKITGNSGTVAGTNFLGTIDNIDLTIRRQNIEKIRVLPATTSFMNEIQTRDGGANSGDILVKIYDSGDDGIIDINENNIMNIRLHGNGVTVFNDQQISTNDFRIETSGQNDMFFIDAGTNRIGIKTTSPINVVDIIETSAIGATDLMQVELNGGTGGALDAIINNTSNGYNAFEPSTTGSGAAIYAFQNNGANSMSAIRAQTLSGDDRWGVFSSDNLLALALFTFSDRELKDNIFSLQRGLDVVKELNPVSYYFKEGNEIGANTKLLHYGFIAQELNELLPNLVAKKSIPIMAEQGIDLDYNNAEMKYSSVNYIELIPILTQAIKEQQVIIESQNKRLDELEKLVKELIKK